MNYSFRSVGDAKVTKKKVFVRCDFDVTIKDNKIIDPTRLISSISTIEFLIENGATVIAAGHLGRPEGIDKKFTLLPVVNWFCEQFNSDFEEIEIEGFAGWKVGKNLIILENLRFFKEEEANDQVFSKKLAGLADIYVNEAFGSSHRSHASIVGIPQYLPHFAGFHLTREVKTLSNILNNPKRPLTFIVGGAKIETKLPLISKMHRFADYVLVGGELAEQTSILAHEAHRRMVGKRGQLLIADLVRDNSDITLDSINKFRNIILKSGMIVWNGPMGYLEKGNTQTTEHLANIILDSKAYKIIGGGDTVSFLNQENLLEGFDFVSMGGGAMLEFLSGIKLPGLIALEK